MNTFHIILIYIVGIVLIYLEIYLPGGICGILGTLAVFASAIAGFYTFGPGIGFILCSIELLGMVIFYIAWIKNFSLKQRPEKGLILNNSLFNYDGYSASDSQLTQLLGKQGKAVTDLRPAGTVIIDTKRIDVVTQGEFIEKGQLVEIIEIEGNRVVAKSIDI